MVLEGYHWVVSIDLQSFFDEIPHGLILRLIRRKIADEGLVTLIARALKAGVVVEGKKDIPFLGFQILAGKIRVSNKARTKFKDKVRELTRRNNPLSMHRNIQALNKYLQGWVACFGIQEFKRLFGDLDGWIRNRLRSMQLKKWKNPRKFQRIMIKAGVDLDIAQGVWIRMNKRQTVSRKPVRAVLSGGGGR